jgi:hypothetical protein
MGHFLALSSVVGKTQKEVVNSLANYAISVNGGLQQENDINSDTANCCIVEEADGNTSVLYPDDYLEWDNSAEFISRELNATVFSLHIHDSDLWMYILYNNGQVIDKFNPVPDYWEDNLSEEEINSWKGDAQVITQYVPYIKPSEIDKYLVRWDLEEEEPSKTYPTDEFAQDEWQLTDFMKKLKLPYPIDGDGNPKGQTYKLWTSQLRLETQSTRTNFKHNKNEKPWWRFW